MLKLPESRLVAGHRLDRLPPRTVGELRWISILASAAAAVVLALPAGASATTIARPVAIGSNMATVPPAIAVDASGNAYIAWLSSNDAVLDFCKVPLADPKCEPVALSVPDPTATMDGTVSPSVIVSGNIVYVFDGVDGATNDDYNGEYLWTSTNAGASFNQFPYAVSGLQDPPSGADTGTTDNPVVALANGDFGVGYNSIGEPYFQANSFAAPANDSLAASPPPPFATLLTPGNAYTVGNLSPAQFASQLTGRPGVLGIFETNAAAPAPCASSENALLYSFGPISAATTTAQINSNGGSGGPWSPLEEVMCDVETATVGGGPSGLGLLVASQDTTKTAYRTFTPPSSFGSPVNVFPTEQFDESLSQDSGGGIYATGFDDTIGVELAYSSDHGAKWAGPVTLFNVDDGALSIGSLASDVNASGQGWATFESQGVQYAQPFTKENTLPPPPKNTKKPVLSGTPESGKTLTCSPGRWTNSPLGYMYSWYRNGTPLVGVSGSTYKLGTLDEGTTIQCVVTAYNGGGLGSADSNKVKVKIPYVKHCAAATGKMTGTQIGSLKLNMTRSEARFVYRDHSTRGFQYKDFFCLTPEGIRAGYATPKLLKTLKRSQRKYYTNRVVWASTSDPYYSLDGVRAGESILTASKRLHTEKPLHIGKNYWYLAVKRGYTAVLKVRGIQVQELGIADNSLTKTRSDQSNLMHSFY
jgi:hypothetical protein